jgi:hypothetical protein
LLLLENTSAPRAINAAAVEKAIEIQPLVNIPASIKSATSAIKIFCMFFIVILPKQALYRLCPLYMRFDPAFPRRSILLPQGQAKEQGDCFS